MSEIQGFENDYEKNFFDEQIGGKQPDPVVAYSDWALDAIRCSAAGGGPYYSLTCSSGTEEKGGYGILVPNKKPRDDGTGNWIRGQKADGKKYQPLSPDDNVLRAVYSGRLAIGWEQPQGDFTTFACIDLDWHAQPVARDEAERRSDIVFEYLRSVFIEPRYVATSSTAQDDTCRGIHVFWVFQRAIAQSVAAWITARAVEHLLELPALGAVPPIEISPYHNSVKPMPVRKANFIRFPLSGHPSEPRGSEIRHVGCHIRLALPSEQNVHGEIKTYREEGSESFHTIPYRACTLTPVGMPDVRRGFNLESWLERVREVKRGDSWDGFVRPLAHELFKRGLLGAEAVNIVKSATGQLQAAGKWSCERSTVQAIADVRSVLNSLQRSRESFWSKPIWFRHGFLAYLLSVPVHERAFLFFCAALASRRYGKVSLTFELVWSYAELCCGFELLSATQWMKTKYVGTKYKVLELILKGNHKRDPKHPMDVTKGRTADEYKYTPLETWLLGDQIVEQELCEKAGLLPLTSALMVRLQEIARARNLRERILKDAVKPELPARTFRRYFPDGQVLYDLVDIVLHVEPEEEK